MASLNGNFVKCAHLRCEEYVQHKFPRETPLCSFHGTYDTTSPVTSQEMFEIYGTTEQAFYERWKILEERVAELTAELNADKNKHGKMIWWNTNFEMCSKCDDVTTFEAACEKCNCCLECSKKNVCSKINKEKK